MEKYRLVCPLLNFNIQNYFFSKGEIPDDEIHKILEDRNRQIIAGIDIFKGIKIKPFTAKDIEDLSSSPLFFAFPDLKKYFSTKNFLLEKIITAEDEKKGLTKKVMQNIVLALRLFKEGHVYGEDFFCFKYDKGYLDSLSRENPLPSHDVMGSTFALDFVEINNLKKLVKKIQRVDFEKRKSLALACDRFQRAYQEYHFEDKLIDYMIAFEALFLKGEKRASSRGEIIAIACSTLLGNNNEERENIKENLKIAYSMRNSIVHGGEYSKDTNPFVIVENISDYLKESIIKFLD